MPEKKRDQITLRMLTKMMDRVMIVRRAVMVPMPWWL